MIHHKKQFIFLHAPRCAGKSVELAIWNQEPAWHSADHRLPSEYITTYGRETWDSYFKFAFARNPWDRMVSRYRVLIQRGNRITEDFNDWLKNTPQMLINVVPQYHWFYYQDQPIDFIGKIENIESDWNYIVKRLALVELFPENYITSKPTRIPLKLPYVNLTKTAGKQKKRFHYTKYYNEESIEIVRERYKLDIEAFGYQFGNRKILRYA
jgi:hypothetical protein